MFAAFESLSLDIIISMAKPIGRACIRSFIYSYIVINLLYLLYLVTLF